MRSHHALIALGILVVAAAAPSAAQANHDFYATAEKINQPGTPLGEDTGFINDVNQYSNGSPFGIGETLPGNFAEPSDCGGNPYGATAWYEVYPHVAGSVGVYVRGDPDPPPNNFDAVISAFRFNPANGVPIDGTRECVDAEPATGTEVLFFNVGGGESWKIQVGGYAGDNNFFERRVDFLLDTDADGVPDFRDACPTTRGDLANGCPSPPPPPPPPPPRPDADGDGIFDDGPDQCHGENSRRRDENNNGCLDLATFSPTWIFRPGSYFVRRGGRIVYLGISVRRFGVSDIPKGARVEVTCSRRACRRMVKTARSEVTFGRLRGKDLRAGVRLTVRVTARGFVGRARVYRIEENDLSVANRCLQPGSSRLRRSCSPVR